MSEEQQSRPFEVLRGALPKSLSILAASLDSPSAGVQRWAAWRIVDLICRFPTWLEPAHMERNAQKKVKNSETII